MNKALCITFLLTILVSSRPLPAVGASDAWVASRVEVALTAMPVAEPDQVEVEADQGVVTLHGTVASRQARERAESAARQVPGVEQVHNLLQVLPPVQAPEVSRPDEGLRLLAATALRTDPELGSSEIIVESVDQGVVVLSGRAAGPNEELRAIQVVGQVPGVRSVITRIQ